MKKIFIALIALLTLLVACTRKVTVENVKKTSTPTLFIHGYSGGKGSFGGMIDRLETSSIAEKSLVLTVDENGEIHEVSYAKPTQNNPLVQILFQNNKSDEFSQAQWIENALLFLKEKYKVEKVNLVGHSMGGVSSLRLLLTSTENHSLPTVEKFVAIASPFNSFVDLSPNETIQNVLNQGPMEKSQRYLEYESQMQNISPTIKTLFIAGDKNDDTAGDGAVPLADALSMVHLFKQNGNPTNEKIFTGGNAQHSKLHENTAVDKLVAEFLWSDN
ncbi:Uncharacterized protein with an alpha/beta hydrolase fold [Pilibacter termitis]|uniref:Uncharacterized protein with an alpha/beta hydrolase fold n=1 Tax=Pilibacter termitis TaxID=263852 RepID=A0A1T4LNX7_9ENTE|nr:alpha/beta hydrolase [Pilibacter termitis]SJZ56361.1 Uncharacterized protein with an alpha/beta hydrolase fold [Pilibacter termitis]